MAGAHIIIAAMQTTQYIHLNPAGNFLLENYVVFQYVSIAKRLKKFRRSALISYN